MKDLIDDEKLEALLTTPSDRLIQDLKKIAGEIIILGAAGKMGPSLATLLKNGLIEAGLNTQVHAVSRFSNQSARTYLEKKGIKTHAGDLLDIQFLQSLPQCPNVIFMAGQKFGTAGNEATTWAMNSYLPGLVAEKYQSSKIVAFSTGNVYPLMPTSGKGAAEEISTGPIGEYAQSCLGRERIFEYFAHKYGTPVLIYRLNYALDLKYGVLNDIGNKIWSGQPIDLSMGHVNIIWQGDANEFAIRSLLHCSSPANHLNVTGLEVHAVKELAQMIGDRLDKKPIFVNKPMPTALLSNAAKATTLFGKPKITVADMCLWSAAWIRSGGKQLNKPTHFQQRDGKF